MNLNKKSYVPILKWKRAEQGALGEIEDANKNNMLPLVELVMPKPKRTLKDTSIEDLYVEVIDIFRTKKMKEIPKEIHSSWGSSPIFVDFTLLYPEVKLQALKTIAADASQLSLNIIPVVNLADDNSFKAEVIKTHNISGNDICIRISYMDLADVPQLNTRLTNYLNLPSVSTANTYLVVDLKDVIDSQEYLRLANASQEIVNITEWKGFILSSGAFPLDLSGCKIDQDNFLPRSDWINWKKQYGRDDLKRIPTFSDYAIRHPVYVESYQFREPTASVKYTLDDSWLIVKGKKRKYEYFLAAAVLLVGYDKFYGKDFSKGDAYIAEKALHYPKYMQDPKIKGTGTTELWLKAGLSHHLSVVFGQLSSLA